MAKRRKTVDNDHFTFVVKKRVFGLAKNVSLVSNYGNGIEEVVLTSENYRDHNKAIERGKELSAQFAVPLVVEE